MYELFFLKALFFTIAIETFTLWLFFKFVSKPEGVNNWLIIFTGIITSFATLPYLWFVFSVFFKTKIVYSIVCETSAVLVEMLIIKGVLRVNYKFALMISFICNMTSYLIGLMIF